MQVCERQAGTLKYAYTIPRVYEPEYATPIGSA